MKEATLVRRREIIAALRNGTVPRRGVELVAVGLERCDRTLAATSARLRRDPRFGDFGEMGLELILAGNHQLALCPREGSATTAVDSAETYEREGEVWYRQGRQPGRGLG